MGYCNCKLNNRYCIIVLIVRAQIISTILQCNFIKARWNIKLQSTSKCIKLVPFLIGTTIPNIVIDILLLTMPMLYVWRLQLTTDRKLLACGIFLLGGL